MFFKKFFLLLFLLVFSTLYAQEKYVLSGYLFDKNNKDPLLFGSVIELNSKKGTSSNEYGFYSLELPKGKHRISVNYVGYKTKEIEINLIKDTKLDINLIYDAKTLENVVVSATRKNERIKSVQTSVNRISVKEIEKMPLFLGERDPIKAIMFLPGVRSAGEGSSNYFVRGGGADQNLVLIDEAQLYNPSHAGGIFSVFNSDVVKTLTLYKGESPAKYGGRLSSVLTVRTKDADINNFKGTATLGVLASKALIEMPIIDNTSSLLLGARRSFIDLFFPFSEDEDLKDKTAYFYDLNAKYVHRIDADNKLYLSVYWGRDALDFNNNMFKFYWGNTATTLSWNHIFNSKLFSNLTFTYNQYQSKLSFDTGYLESLVRDFAIKQKFQYYHSDSSKYNFGAELIHHTYIPGNIVFENYNIERSLKRYGFESNSFMSHNWKINDSFSLDYGFRFSMYSILGPTTVYTFDDLNEIKTEKEIKEGIIKTYYNVEPRITGAYIIDENQSFKFACSYNTQYLNILSTNNAGTPIDTYLPVTTTIAPQKSIQGSIGYFRNFDDNMYEFSGEVYYKNMWDLTDYAEGADIFDKRGVEAHTVKVSGRAYGAELMIKKRKGKLTGWIAYTLSKVTLQSDEINNGERYVAPQDRPMDLYTILMYDLNDKWHFTMAFTYNSGIPITLPKGQYYVEERSVISYSNRNEYRMPDYHRLDVSATYKTTFYGLESKVAMSIFNVYGRKNPMYLDFTYSENSSSYVYLYGILPSISWTVNF